MKYLNLSLFFEQVCRERKNIIYSAYIALFFSMLIFSNLPADVSKVVLPSIFTDNMMLQRDCENSIWGTATPGDKINVLLGSAKASVTVAPDGKWLVRLPSLPAGGPYELIVSGINGKVIHNVLIGDVWLCAGQSNMLMPLSESDDFDRKQSNYPKIHFFQVHQNSANQPREDVEGTWHEANPKNILTLSAVAYHFAREVHSATQIPIGIILCANNGSQIKSWISEDFLGYRPKKLLHFSTSSLYNGMIAPIIGFSIKGIIWYQGEADIFSAAEYQKLLALLVRNWRQKLRQNNLPFLCVQLTNYGKQAECPSESAWAELREAQFKACKIIPNAYLTVSIDLGGLSPELHPKNKKGIGHRLALIALGAIYGQPVIYNSPCFDSAFPLSHAIEISFSAPNTRLIYKGNKIEGFIIAGVDRKFYDANATILSGGQKMLVQSYNVKNPVAVRYAWADNPKCNLYSESDLPVIPFRSDSWKCFGSSKHYNFMNELIREANSQHAVIKL